MFQNKPQPQVFGNKNKPDDSAQIEIVSTTKGFLKPRMTTAERLAIPAPVAGLKVYDTDVNTDYLWNGTSWVSAGGISGPSPVVDDSIVRYDGTLGILVQDSNVLLNDLDEVTGITRLEVDNVQVDGNEISTLNVDGDLVLTPNGTGKVVISKDLQVLGTTTTVNSDTLTVVDPNITINSGGDQATANTFKAGLTVEMSDAPDLVFGYDSTTTSKAVVGEVGTEKEVVTVSDIQVLTNKTMAVGASVAAGLSLDTSSISLATLPWPRMTDAERNVLLPSQGWVIYNTTQNELNIYDGNDWIPYNIGVYFMIENGYERDFVASNLTTTFETIKTISGGTLKAMNVVNNSGNTIVIRVTTGGVQLLVAPGDNTQIGYRGLSGDVVQIATVAGTATTGNIYINFLGV